MKNIYLSIFSLFLCLSFGASAAANGITCTVIIDDALCDQTNGGASIEVSGGVAPYSYEWSNGLTSNAGTGLNTGIYVVTVSDSAGCTTECTFTIFANQPQLSFNCLSGQLSVDVENATPPYTYEWGGGETTPVIDVIDGGSYTVTVVDAIGCQATERFDYTTFPDFNCGQNIFLSLATGPFGGGTAKIFLETFLSGPYRTCDTDYQIRVEDSNGTEIIPFTSDFVTFDCSHIGVLSFTVMEMVSGESCSGTVNVEVKTPPVAVADLTSSATLVNDEVEVFANLFDNGSYASCGGVRFTYTSTPPEQDPNFDQTIGASSRAFTCVDFFGFNGAVDVTIYVWDDFGNWNSVWSTLILEMDSNNPCSIDGEYVRVMQGVCNAQGDQKYSLELNGSTSIEVSDCLGFIEDGSIQAGINTLEITDNDIDLGNGVTTLDLVMIHRGIVFGVSSAGFITPLEAIASDIDNNGSVSTGDLLETRRRILGMTTGEGFSDYKIVLTSHDFGADFDPFDMGSNFLSLEFDSGDLDGVFLPVTVIRNGDLNFSAASLTSEVEAESRAISLLNYADEYIKAGETKVIDFNLDASNNIEATTFKLSGDGINFDNIDGNGQDVLVNYVDGEAFISFVSNGQVVNNFEFSLEVTAIDDVQLSEVITLGGTINEVVSSDLGTDDISLVANASTSSKDLENVTMSIFPNPAKNVININFEQAMEREVKLISLNGQAFGMTESNDASLSLDVADMTDGIYFLHVNSASGSQIQKILIQK